MKSRGFTLLEVLVVMMLVTLLSTLLFQGYSQVIAVVSRLSGQSHEGVKITLEKNWYHKLLSHIINYQTAENDKLLLSANHIKAVTTEPLLSYSGIPTLFELKLKNDKGIIRLIYSESKGNAIDIGRWEGDKATFMYSEDLKKWVKNWKSGTLKPTKLPKIILIEIETEKQKKSYYSALNSFNYDGPVKFIP